MRADSPLGFAPAGVCVFFPASTLTDPTAWGSNPGDEGSVALGPSASGAAPSAPGSPSEDDAPPVLEPTAGGFFDLPGSTAAGGPASSLPLASSLRAAAILSLTAFNSPRRDSLGWSPRWLPSRASHQAGCLGSPAAACRSFLST